MENITEHYIRDDIAGRLRNTPLPYGHSLLPLFEAIVNSIQSIEELDSKSLATIDIYINRNTQQSSIDYGQGEKNYPPIDGYSIVDNGKGFNAINFESFKTADSRLKERKGGKGVGRFIWLKAFNSVDIDSIYSEEEKLYKRSFSFEARGTGIQKHDLLNCNDGTPKTTVKLRGLRAKYQDKTPSQPDTIAQKIIDHCVVYLLSDDCPAIRLIDKVCGVDININDKFRNEVAAKTKTVKVAVNDIQFSLTLLYLNSNYKGEHKVSLCADNREVKSFSLKKLVPDINGKKLPIAKDEEGTLIVLASSSYLDESVNQERTDFLFSRSSKFETDDGFDITESDLLDEISSVVRNEFSNFFESIIKEKIVRIQKFVEREEPEYRVLLKHAKEKLITIPDGLDDHRLDTELHKILHDVEISLKEEGRKFINEDLITALENPQYKQSYDSYVNKLLDLRQSELSKYVLHRKTIIDLLGKLLQRKEGGKYSLEDEIHKLLYPMKTTSLDSEFGQQNLWLIDEKLTYHYFLASDLEFNKMESVAVNSANRPDVLVVDRPASFVEGEYPHHAVVIIELKRPQRKNYSSSEKDPFDQVYGYIDEMRDGKIIGDDGAHIELSRDTRFYCYIIADLTTKIRQKAKRNGFRETIDKDGYFYFNENYNAYVEVISYRKLYEDAKKRNRVLFEKLGLPLR